MRFCDTKCNNMGIHIAQTLAFSWRTCKKRPKEFFFFLSEFKFFFETWYFCWDHGIWQLKEKQYLNITPLNCVLGVVTGSFWLCFLCFLACIKGHNSPYSRLNEMMHVKTSSWCAVSRCYFLIHLSLLLIIIFQSECLIFWDKYYFDTF